jgi:hypothetical protein
MAELAWVPKTTLGFRMVMAAAAAVTPTNSRRPTPVSFESLIELFSSVGRLEPRDDAAPARGLLDESNGILVLRASGLSTRPADAGARRRRAAFRAF